MADENKYSFWFLKSKTFYTGMGMIAYATLSYFLGKMDLNTAFQTGSTGAGLIFLRHGMEK